MGKRGPIPQPSAVKLAKGERRPSRVNYAEPVLPEASIVRLPAGITGAGRKEWLRLAPMLTAAGVLKESDAIALEDYCRCLSELREAERARKKSGVETEDGQRLQGLVLKLRGQANTLRRELGLTPSSRAAIRIPAKPQTAGDERINRYLRAIPGGKKMRKPMDFDGTQARLDVSLEMLMDLRDDLAKASVQTIRKELIVNLTDVINCEEGDWRRLDDALTAALLSMDSAERAAFQGLPLAEAAFRILDAFDVEDWNACIRELEGLRPSLLEKFRHA
jgi:P27 family predicted phage terminase small subunit